MSINETALFNAIRTVKGSGLTQADVDLVKRALMAEVVAAATGMKASQKCLDFIHSFETLKLTTYKDPGSKNGLPITGGWGSTRDHNGQPFKLGFTAPKDYWDKLFARDFIATEVGVNLLIGKAPTTQAQFDAMVSMAYNVGLDIDDDTIAEGLGDSSLLKKHLRGDYAGAAAAFASWKYNDGKVLNGLVRRRAAEAAMYLGK